MTPDMIWGEDAANGRQADLFERRQEAEQLIAYIESVVGRPTVREDKKAYTIAVDARYGEGKTFFLRRLAEHLEFNHPVAFVDAWADDLADEPLTALAATLKTALAPFSNNQEIKDGLSDFIQKTGQVAKIVSKGLLRRGASLAITGAAVNAVEEVLSGASDDLNDAVNDNLNDIGKGIADDAAEGLGATSAQALMEQRIKGFEDTKKAVQQMKISLKAIVNALEGRSHHAPIVIIIDELDRCRPTYAVKLLEEIKHLFDVPGLVFILGLYGDQLGHSISGAYGAGFEGRAYLRRFIDREYRLATPKLTPLLEKLCLNAAIPDQALKRPPLSISNNKGLNPPLPELLAEYMRAYGLGARDAFQLIDIIQTSVAIAEHNKLVLPYFLPLAIGLIQGLPEGHLPEQQHLSNWGYIPNWFTGNQNETEISFEKMALAISNTASLPYSQIRRLYSGSNQDYALGVSYDSWVPGVEEQPIWTLRGYPRLLRAVARFTNPQLGK